MLCIVVVFQVVPVMLPISRLITFQQSFFNLWLLVVWLSIMCSYTCVCCRWYVYIFVKDYTYWLKATAKLEFSIPGILGRISLVFWQWEIIVYFSFSSRNTKITVCNLAFVSKLVLLYAMISYQMLQVHFASTATAAIFSSRKRLSSTKPFLLCFEMTSWW